MKTRLSRSIVAASTLWLGGCGFGVGGTPYPGVLPDHPDDVYQGGGSFIVDDDCAGSNLRNPAGPQCGGLRGQYFLNASFGGEALLKIDDVLRYWSGTGYGKHPDWAFPNGVTPPAEFSVRWDGFILVNRPYQLCVYSDDQARVMIDGQIAVDAWTRHSPQLDCGFPLVPDSARPLRSIRVEYSNVGGGGALILMFKNGAEEQIVPTSYLYHQP